LLSWVEPGQQVVRPGTLPAGAGAVEGVHADAEALRLAAHLVQRHQPVPAIERRVFDTLGRDRAGVLLELEREAQHPVAVGVGLSPGDVCQQYIANEVEHGQIRHAAATSRLGDGFQYLVAVVVAAAAGGQVGAVDREAGDHLHQRAAQGVQRVVAGMRVQLGDA
jgi:hypothetical protein